MKPALTLLAALAIGAAAITITPTQHDFGKTAVGGVAQGQFTLTSTVNDSLTVWLTGANPNQFLVEDYANGVGPNTPQLTNAGNYKLCENQGMQYASCKFDITFRPNRVGVMNAILEVTNRAGMRTRVPLRGEGVKPDCVQQLVFCNYVTLYTGSIQVRIIDSTSTNERKARFEEDFTIQVNSGVVTCTGMRLEFEQNIHNNTPENEIKGQGPIAGSGMLAVEFDLNSQGKFEYVLTYACPTPTMTKTSTDYKSGNSETETFPGGPADWNSSQRLTDPKPATAQGMTPLVGKHTNTSWDRANQQGYIMMSTWDLKHP